jgi:hypothetical protein
VFTKGGNRYVLGLVTAAGITALAGSWLAESSAWWSSVFIEIGTALLLLAPLLSLTKRIEGRVEESERQTLRRVDELTETVSSAQENLARTMADVSLIVGQRLAEERRSDEDVYEALKFAASREDLIGALRRGRNYGIISASGPRTDLFDTDFYLRFSLHDGDMPRVVLGIETIEGEKFHSEEWKPGQSLPDLLTELGRVLKKRGRWPGEVAYQPGYAFEELADLLLIGSRVHARGGDVRGIIQLVRKDWFVTDRGICPVRRPSYFINASRLDESDWDQHMSTKPWVKIENFRLAYDIALGLRSRGLLEDEITGIPTLG